MVVRVLLAESYRLVRDAFRALLEATGEFRIVADASDGPAAMEQWREHRPDVLLMAVHLKSGSGIDAAVGILKESPRERIVLLAPDANDALLLCAARCGARGLVLAESPATELFEAMRTVAAGGFYMDTFPSASGEEARIEALSPREQEVLQMVAAGLSSKEIAAELGLGLETVRTYRKSMMKKLNVTNAAEATRAAIAGGLSTPAARVQGAGGQPR